jgi:hypothetical protein
MRYARTLNKYQRTRDADLYSHFSEIGFMMETRREINAHAEVRKCENSNYAAEITI